MIFLHKVRFVEACNAPILVISLFATPIVISEPIDDSLIDSAEYNAVIETEWAINTNSHNSQKQEFILEPEADININNNVSLFALGRLRFDRKDNIDPDDNMQSELRELYINTQFNSTSVLAGKQQVVWGKSDGLKVLDVVNPQDFREFILDDFDQSRIPLWTLNIEATFADNSLQFLWIPDQTYNKFSAVDGTYAFTSNLIIPPSPPDTIVIRNITQTPDDTFSNADYGVRYATFWEGWDFSLNYLYHYDDTPVLFRRLNQTNNGLEVILNPEYKRSHLIGGSFSTSIDDLTLRGEVGYSTDKYISTINPSDIDGVVNTGEFTYVLGFDWFGYNDSLISFQLFQTYLDNHQPGMIKDDVTSQATLLIKHDAINETLHSEILWLQDLDINDGILRPKITYELNDEINISAGFDIFYGDKNGLYGQFKDTDRIIFNLTIGI